MKYHRDSVAASCFPRKPEVSIFPFTMSVLIDYIRPKATHSTLFATIKTSSGLVATLLSDPCDEHKQISLYLPQGIADERRARSPKELLSVDHGNWRSLEGRAAFEIERGASSLELLSM